MKQTALRKYFFITLSIFSSLLFSSCSQREVVEETPADKISLTINIAYPNWAEGVAITYLLADVIKNDLGSNVNLTIADPDFLYASLADGSQDVLLDAWLPVTHDSYMKKYGSELEVIGTTYKSARIGLVVPEYVDINSIEDLNKNAEDFGGKIIGIGQSSGIMKHTGVAIREYGMDSMELVPFSDCVMCEALGNAIKNHESIVVTGWTPHWIFAVDRLKFLNDPKGIYGNEEQIRTVVRKGFTKDHPEVASMLSRVNMNGVTLCCLMNSLSNAKTDETKKAATHEWISRNRYIVNSWLGKD